MSRLIRTWSELRESYSSYSLPCMLELVTAIENSRFSSGLFAWQSHMDLYIVQMYVEHPYTGPALRVSPIGKSCEKVEFRYIDTPDKSNQWHRTVDGANAFARLEDFIQQLNWFAKYQIDSNSERRETR